MITITNIYSLLSTLACFFFASLYECKSGAEGECLFVFINKVVNNDPILLSALCPVNLIALRLYPSVPRNMKVAVQDDVWPGTQSHFQLRKQKGRHISIEHSKPNSPFFQLRLDGTKIYKGEFASWNTWTMGRDTTIWGPDAREYNPDRWMTGEKFPAHKFPAFHAGPRTWYLFPIYSFLTCIRAQKQVYSLLSYPFSLAWDNSLRRQRRSRFWRSFYRGLRLSWSILTRNLDISRD